MEKILDPYDNTIHLLDKRRKDKLGLFYLCVCGKRSGLFWEKIDATTPLTCLICLMYERRKCEGTYE